MVDSSVIVAIISTTGGVLIAYFTLKYKDVKVARARLKKPKDRQEAIYDGYESLVRELNKDSDRKSKIIDSLQIIVDAQRVEIEKSQRVINELRDEVTETRAHTKQLLAQLDTMKKDLKREGE